MDWLHKMNAAMDYIENNITWDMDYHEISRIVGCPYYHFQRMFAFMTEMSLSEYVRCRRLTLAAFELQQSDQSVIEIALKYGYESHAAFTRAFNDLHGITPTAARKPGARLKAYPQMSFHASLGGGTAMNYRIEKMNAFSAVGMKHCVKTDRSFDSVPKIWQDIAQNGIADRLTELMDSGSGPINGGVLGILSEGQWGRKDEFLYYTAVSYDKDSPDGMDKIDFPESQWAVFEAPALADLPKAWKQLYTDWLPTSGYSLAGLPAIECYYPPGHTPQNELWIPINRPDSYRDMGKE